MDISMEARVSPASTSVVAPQVGLSIASSNLSAETGKIPDRPTPPADYRLGRAPDCHVRFLVACCELRRAASDFTSVVQIPIVTWAISLSRESFTEIQPPCQVSSSDNSLATRVACAFAT